MCEPRVVEVGTSRKRCVLPVLLSVGALAVAVLVVQGVRQWRRGETKSPAEEETAVREDADLRHSAADAKFSVEGRGEPQVLAVKVPKVNWGCRRQNTAGKGLRKGEDEGESEGEGEGRGWR